MSDGATTMLIGGVLAPGAICPRVTASEKRQVLSVVSEVAARTYRLKAAEVLDALLEREAALRPGSATASPCRTPLCPGVSRVSGVFLRLKPAIDFQAVDDEPVDLVLALLAPPADGGEHLRALARAARALRSAGTASAVTAGQRPGRDPGSPQPREPSARGLRPLSSSVDADRREFVRERGGDGRVLVAHHRKSRAVGAVDRVENLLGLQVEPLDLFAWSGGDDLSAALRDGHRPGPARPARRKLRLKGAKSWTYSPVPENRTPRTRHRLPDRFWIGTRPGCLCRLGRAASMCRRPWSSDAPAPPPVHRPGRRRG